MTKADEQADRPQAEPKAEQQAQPPAPLDQDALGLKELAQAILDRKFRPRVASVRRLAEAVLAKGQGKKKARKGEKKVRKLATIPGQKGRKKA
ncbi:hypothetical protein M3P36_04760 [Altererythrobacter sp. KTW20L]|uniref:hypothetical protein n=1 Tax=Altererythrobacter sp. KTW20L TaxID=2942210 RepID=UPI0020BF9FE6|nr:hypothetical protein [Altererythrobacter sp. KTW20L]MCL6250360.1 hypothetical protein [Altererythrobacter sp. KTW20L]